MSSATDLQDFDRTIIYTDGSSKALDRHRPAIWNEEGGGGDTWSCVVVGECLPGSHRAIEVIGWMASTMRTPVHTTLAQNP